MRKIYFALLLMVFGWVNLSAQIEVGVDALVETPMIMRYGLAHERPAFGGATIRYGFTGRTTYAYTTLYTSEVKLGFMTRPVELDNDEYWKVGGGADLVYDWGYRNTKLIDGTQCACDIKERQVYPRLYGGLTFDNPKMFNDKIGLDLTANVVYYPLETTLAASLRAFVYFTFDKKSKEQGNLTQ